MDGVPVTVVYRDGLPVGGGVYCSLRISGRAACREGLPVAFVYRDGLPVGTACL